MYVCMYGCMSTRTPSVMYMIYVYNEKMYNDNNTEQNEYYDIPLLQQQQQHIAFKRVMSNCKSSVLHICLAVVHFLIIYIYHIHHTWCPC